jgi:outer membrane lipoprotein SlyB
VQLVPSSVRKGTGAIIGGLAGAGVGAGTGAIIDGSKKLQYCIIQGCSIQMKQPFCVD